MSQSLKGWINLASLTPRCFCFGLWWFGTPSK